ncbi:MAG: hypothetical protein HRU43_07855 [Simkaniaceae bacterium]|nr:hypothetical protein [Simkaniaceae bacterium]
MKKLLILLVPLASLYAANYNRYLPPPPKQEVQKGPPPATITPAFSPIKGNTYDIALQADVLCLTSSITNLSYATKHEALPSGNALLPNSSNLAPQKAYEFDWGYSPGVRVSFGVNTDFDGWDFALDWTYFSNGFKESKKVPAVPNGIDLDFPPIGTELLSNSWSDFSSSDSLATSISAKGNVQLNQLNLMTGRKFLLSRRLALRPFGGVRALFSHLDLRSTKGFETAGQAALTNLIVWNDRRKQKVWSVGTVVGVDSSWNIYKSFSLFGSGDIALCYGPYKNHTSLKTHSQSTAILADSHTNSRFNHDQIWTLQQILDLAFGFRYEKTWNNPKFDERFRMVLDFGWESHVYPGYNHIDQATSTQTILDSTSIYNTPTTFRSSNGSLSLAGIVFRGHFQF